MPFKIIKRKGSKPFKIIKVTTGKQVGSSTSMAKAKASIKMRHKKK
jgi:hypothetical protein